MLKKTLLISILLGLPLGLFIQSSYAQQPLGFAALPTDWVDMANLCRPPNDTFEVEVTLTTLTQVGFQAAMNAWDGTKWYRLKVPSDLDLVGPPNVTSPDGNKVWAYAPVRSGVSKCLVVEATNPPTRNRLICSGGMPDYGGVRNPGCTNDIHKLWHIKTDAVATSGLNILYWPVHTSHVVIRDYEVTILPGKSQSQKGVKVPILVVMQGDVVGTEYLYVHGWDAGDPGQPGIGSGNPAVNNSTGVCHAWDKSGTVTTSGSTVTWNAAKNTVTGNADRFGQDFADTAALYGWAPVVAGQANQLLVNGVAYTITNHDPTVTDTVLTVSPAPGTNATPVNFSMTNPRIGFETGCGDDVRPTQFACTHCWVGWPYVEKDHWWGNEGHALSSGYGGNYSTGVPAGPFRVFSPWLEAGAGGLFVGGKESDLAGGPMRNMEVGPYFIGRNPEYRFLSAASGGSPGPPFGCGPIDGNGAHDTCSFNYAFKNLIEFKECEQCEFWGGHLSGNWSDGQSGYSILLNIRVASGGETGGVYDPVTGRPATNTRDIRFDNLWMDSGAQGVQISSRALGAGNGGGISRGMKGIDFVNVAFTGMGDPNQFGNPGPDIFQWAATSQTFLATMTRPDGLTAHAVAQPMNLASWNYQTGPLANVGTYNSAYNTDSIIRSGCSGSGPFTGCTVTVKLGANRHDPKVGGTWTILNQPGWNGVFTITGATRTNSSTLCDRDNFGDPAAAPVAVAIAGGGPCVRADGTFADAITYADNQGGNGTLCSAATVNCDGPAPGGIDVHSFLDTLAYKVVDLAPGDGVYVHNCTGGSNPTSYQVGAAAFVPTTAGTNPAGLDVFYANPGSVDNTGATTCQLDNGSGLPNSTSIQRFAYFSPRIMSIGSNGISGQHYLNVFMHNTFAMPAGNNAVLTDSDVGGQGSAVYAAWDANTFQFFDNVMPLRTISQWPSVPGSAAVNVANPPLATFSCSGATADSTCLGWQHYMSGVVFPSTPCAFNVSPNNCPTMPPPWSNNFHLNYIKPVASSLYKLEMPDIDAMEASFVANIYTCPVGANCGPHGPYPAFGTAPGGAQTHIVKGGRTIKGSVIKK